VNFPEKDAGQPAVLVVVAVGYVLVAAWYGVVAGRWARRVGDDIADAKPEPVRLSG